MVIVALVTTALSPLSMRRRLCHCQASIIALVACCQAGIVVIVVMTSLSSMRRHLCHYCDCNCCPHDNGIAPVVDAQAFLLSFTWCCCPRNNCVVAFDLQPHCFPLHNGVVAVLKLTSSPLLRWHLHHHQCAGILAIITMALLPLLQWHCCC